jgi:hypothetical protein
MIDSRRCIPRMSHARPRLGSKVGLSAWESVQSGPSIWADLRNGLSVSDRESTRFTPVNGPLMARRPDHAGPPFRVIARTVEGMAPYPGQASCLALNCWPECFRRLTVNGGRRPFPKETRSAVDGEGKYATIQGPSLAASPATQPLDPQFHVRRTSTPQNRSLSTSRSTRWPTWTGRRFVPHRLPSRQLRHSRPSLIAPRASHRSELAFGRPSWSSVAAPR